MKTGLLKRLKRLEEVQATENLPAPEFQSGYLKQLPAEYTGERHIVTVGRDADGYYRRQLRSISHRSWQSTLRTRDLQSEPSFARLAEASRPSVSHLADLSGHSRQVGAIHYEFARLPEGELLAFSDPAPAPCRGRSSFGGASPRSRVRWPARRERTWRKRGSRHVPSTDPSRLISSVHG